MLYFRLSVVRFLLSFAEVGQVLDAGGKAGVTLVGECAIGFVF